MFNPGLYKITTTVNGKIYIGKANDIEKRFSQHKSDLKLNKHKNTHLQNAYNKYGSSVFVFDVILYCAEETLNQYEQDLIYLSESYKDTIGYNLTMGGEGQRATQETKDKISLALLGKKKSKEHIEKCRQNRLGSKRSDEIKAKMSKIMLGRKPSDIAIQNSANNRRGKTLSDEHKNNLSVANKGKISPMLGKKHTEETKVKISNAMKAKVS